MWVESFTGLDGEPVDGVEWRVGQITIGPDGEIAGQAVDPGRHRQHGDGQLLLPFERGDRPIPGQDRGAVVPGGHDPSQVGGPGIEVGLLRSVVSEEGAWIGPAGDEGLVAGGGVGGQDAADVVQGSIEATGDLQQRPDAGRIALSQPHEGRPHGPVPGVGSLGVVQQRAGRVDLALAGDTERSVALGQTAADLGVLHDLRVGRPGGSSAGRPALPIGPMATGRSRLGS